MHVMSSATVNASGDVDTKLIHSKLVGGFVKLQTFERNCI